LATLAFVLALELQATSTGRYYYWLLVMVIQPFNNNCNVTPLLAQVLAKERETVGFAHTHQRLLASGLSGDRCPAAQDSPRVRRLPKHKIDNDGLPARSLR